MNKRFRGEPYCRMAAWVYLLLQVSYDEAKSYGHSDVNLHPGQMIFSLRNLAKEWNWSKSKVERFLMSLQAEGMILIEVKDKVSILTIVNWQKYQSPGHQSRHLTPSDSECSEGMRDTCGTPTGTPTGTLTGTPSKTPNNLFVNDYIEVAGTPTGTLTGTPTGTPTGTQEIYNKNIKKEKKHSAADDLRTKIGAAAAQLWLQTEIENILDPARLESIQRWLEYKNQKHQPLKTTHELHYLVKLAESMTPERFRAMVDFSAGNGYSRLYEDFDKPKQTSQDGKKPDYRKYYS